MQLAVYTIGLSTDAFMLSWLKSYRLPPCPPQLCDPVSSAQTDPLMLLYVCVYLHTIGMYV